MERLARSSQSLQGIQLKTPPPKISLPCFVGTSLENVESVVGYAALAVLLLLIPAGSITKSRTSMSTNLQQLNFENQRGTAWNHRRVPVVPVGNVGRANQSGLPSYLHLLHTFSPATNDAA
jgi:hypothetical protein